MKRFDNTDDIPPSSEQEIKFDDINDEIEVDVNLSFPSINHKERSKSKENINQQLD